MLTPSRHNSNTLQNIKPGASEKIADSASQASGDNSAVQKGSTNVYVNNGNQNLRQPCTITYNTLAQEIVNQSINWVTVAVTATMAQSQKFSVQAKAMQKLQSVFPDVVWQPISLKQQGKCEYGGSVCNFIFLVKGRLDNEQMQILTNQGQIVPAGDKSPTLNGFGMQYTIANANNIPDPNFTAEIKQKLENKLLANISKQIKTVNQQLGANYELQKVDYYPIQFDANKDRLSQEITMGAKYVIATNCKAGEVVRQQ
ncbi:hypothetical protein OAO18_08875 [Francisellaceae bacterium]|nr:hypothetical protein [Francisellaceae bacterium]